MSTLPARPAQRLNLQDKTPGTRDDPAHAHLPRGSLLPASCQLSINAVVVGIGLNLDGLGLGRRSHVDRLFSFLSLIGRYPALNNPLHHLVGVLLVDVRYLLALVSHGNSGIARAFELGARGSAPAREVQKAHEPQLVAIVIPIRPALFVFLGGVLLGQPIGPLVKFSQPILAERRYLVAS